ncbi:hypothetical protein OL548_24960 [Lysinibacillus sp. MHQ-1]|nr:hypothetical protein OL548_24960 [Lysinibacillus sp. MHQ-1]
MDKGGAEQLAELLNTNVLAHIPFAQPEENTGSSVYDADTIIGEIFYSPSRRFALSIKKIP